MKICVLGTHALTDEGPKVGIQHIAETLALLGHEVVYVTSHASPLMLLLPAHRARYRRASAPLRVRPGLTQVTPTKLLPARTLHQLEALPGAGLIARLDRTVERAGVDQLDGERFDVCICSASGTLSLVHRIRSSRLYYRLNDLLAGFDRIPRALVREEGALLRSPRLDGVWAVNAQLADYARGAAPTAEVAVVPNGVATGLFAAAEPDPALLSTRERNVIYVGAIEFWVDVALMLATARLLPDHAFHVFGPWAVPVPADMPPNVHLHGPVSHHAIAAKMKGCAVGIIPAGEGNRGRMVEKPLKFYEYLAAGLGVAATPWAGSGLEPFAVIGDTAESFARAIVAARAVPLQHAADIGAAVAARDWRVLVRQMLPDA